jgi:hypothetical protein
VGLTQQFRTGLSIEPRAGVVRTEDVTAGSSAGNAAQVALVNQKLAQRFFPDGILGSSLFRERRLRGESVAARPGSAATSPSR